MRKEIIEASEEDNEMNDEETIEEFDQPLAVPEVNSVQGAMQLFKKLTDSQTGTETRNCLKPLHTPMTSCWTSN